MMLLDVNVVVYAFWPGAPRHHEVRAWLSAASKGAETLLVPDVVLSGFVRVVTNPKKFGIAEPLDNALKFADALIAGPAVVLQHPGSGHWGIFRDLCRRVNATGNLVTDAYIAAMALEAGATMATFDDDYRRFPGLSWSDPTGAQVITNPP